MNIAVSIPEACLEARAKRVAAIAAKHADAVEPAVILVTPFRLATPVY